jgi:UDP-N-acetylmuramate dehydrogenase
VTKTKKDEIEQTYPDIKYFPFKDGYKIAAGWLIEKAGWKGKTFKTAGVSPNHALILINPGGANANDIYTLSEKIIEDIKAKFDIKLVREVQLINF